MKFNNVVIESFHYYLPETIISSDEIENRLRPIYEKLNLPEGRLELMTGIKERRVWPVGTRPSKLSYEAAKNCLNKSKIKKDDIDLLIHASVCRDFLEPATASVVHSLLKLPPKTMIFDLSNACLGVMNALVVAAHMIENGSIKNALIVSGENSAPLLESTINELLKNTEINRKNIKRYIANLTIGSGATAFILGRKDQHPNSPELLGGISLTDTEANHLCLGDGNTHELVMQTDSEELLKYGIRLGISAWRNFLSEMSWTSESIDLVLTHQVGSAHEKLSHESFGTLKNKTYSTYPYLGNTGSSALPITLMKAFEEDMIQSKDTIAMLGIGSGLSSIMLGIKWN